MVAKLILHLAKEDSASVHVGLCNDASKGGKQLSSLKANDRANVLSLSLGRILAMVEQAEVGNALHHTGSRVAEKLAAGLEGSVNANVMIGSHVKVARLGRMVRRLFRNVVRALIVVEIPIAGKGFTENGVERLLDTTGRRCE